MSLCKTLENASCKELSYTEVRWKLRCICSYSREISESRSVTRSLIWRKFSVCNTDECQVRHEVETHVPILSSSGNFSALCTKTSMLTSGFSAYDAVINSTSFEMG